MASYYGDGIGTSAQPILTTLKSETRLFSAKEAMASDDFSMAQQLYELWQSLATDVPQSKQLKIAKLDPSMMSNMVILDILDGGKDYQWRLFGTTHADQYGDDLTGRRVSSVLKENPSVETLRNIFNKAAADTNGTFFELHYLSEGSRIKVATGVMVPLADSQGRIIQLCGCCDWY